MTRIVTTSTPTRAESAGSPPVPWHRPLLALAAAMAVLAVVSVVGLIVDPREVTGINVWAKPLKFALSTGIYAVTLAWMIGQLHRLRRLAWVAGTVSAILLAIELAIIVFFAAVGETSHFNVTTVVHTISWAVMAASISTLWVMAFLIAIALFRNRLGDSARTWAIRAGLLIAIVGMALAFLMTGPHGDQISNYQGIVGAHTVGAEDGGPGLPILGWSTVAGDLRIPHFVGMHVLQVLPIVAIGLELGARRVQVLTAVAVRLRLVAVATAGYVGLLGILTVQALIGESIVRPSVPVMLATAVLVAGVVVATAVVLRRSGNGSQSA
jgi:hypothetical protein